MVLVCIIMRDPQVCSMMQTGVLIPVKNTNGVVSGSEIQSHAPPDWFFFDLVNPPLFAE